MNKEIQARIRGFQVIIAVFHILIIIIGGCIFGLAVALRPILRITKPEFDYMVTTFCDVMIATGISHVISGGFDIFAACWKLKWPIIIAIVLSSLVIVLDMVAMATAFYLLTQAEVIANENILHAWYWVECQVGSCKVAMLHYIHRYMMPQAALAAAAIFLQCMGLIYLGRLVRCVIARETLIENYRRAHEGIPPTNASKKEQKKIRYLRSPCSRSRDHTDTAADHDNYHTPTSILKVDHGYVAVSGASLNFDDTLLRNRSKLPTPPSISFNTNVQVHYFDVNKKYSAVDLTTCLKNENPELCSINRAVSHYENVATDPGAHASQQKARLESLAENIEELLGRDKSHYTLDDGDHTRSITPPPAPPPTPILDGDDCCGNAAYLPLPVSPCSFE